MRKVYDAAQDTVVSWNEILGLGRSWALFSVACRRIGHNCSRDRNFAVLGMTGLSYVIDLCQAFVQPERSNLMSHRSDCPSFRVIFQIQLEEPVCVFFQCLALQMQYIMF